MEYLSTKYGLVTDNDPVTENGQLFLVELILLQDFLGADFRNNQLVLDTQLENSQVQEGLFHRNPDLIDRCASHDNVTSIFAYSFFDQNNVRFEIWKYLLTHFGTYDNTKGKSKQLSRFLPFNLGNFFIWGVCAESNIYLLFLPFYLINLLISSNKPSNDTSGKILNWVELYPHKEHWLCKHLFGYYEKKMKKMYSENYVKELMRIYHGNNSSEFPINKLLGL